MSDRYARCLNFDYCTLGDRRLVMRLAPGEPFFCPECAHALASARAWRSARRIPWPAVGTTAMAAAAIAACALVVQHWPQQMASLVPHWLAPARSAGPPTEVDIIRGTAPPAGLPDPGKLFLAATMDASMPPGAGSYILRDHHRRPPRSDPAAVEAVAQLEAGVQGLPVPERVTQAAMPWHQAMIMAALLAPGESLGPAGPQLPVIAPAAPDPLPAPPMLPAATSPPAQAALPPPIQSVEPHPAGVPKVAAASGPDWHPGQGAVWRASVSTTVAGLPPPAAALVAIQKLAKPPIVHKPATPAPPRPARPAIGIAARKPHPAAVSRLPPADAGAAAYVPPAERHAAVPPPAAGIAAKQPRSAAAVSVPRPAETNNAAYVPATEAHPAAPRPASGIAAKQPHPAAAAPAPRPADADNAAYVRPAETRPAVPPQTAAIAAKPPHPAASVPAPRPADAAAAAYVPPEQRRPAVAPPPNPAAPAAPAKPSASGAPPITVVDVPPDAAPPPAKRVVIVPSAPNMTFGPLKAGTLNSEPIRPVFIPLRPSAAKPQEAKLTLNCIVETSGVPTHCLVLSSSHAGALSDAMAEWLASGMVRRQPKSVDGHLVRSRQIIVLNFPAQSQAGNAKK